MQFKSSAEKAQISFQGHGADYYGQMNDLLDFLDEISAFIKARAEHLESNQPPEFNLKHLEQEYQYAEAFGPILHQSFLLSLVTFLEHAVNDFLGVVREWRVIPISPSDLRGDLLEKIKVYAFRLGRLRIEMAQELWQDVGSVVAIRNCLVHHAGRVSGNPQNSQIYAFSDRHSGLIIEEGAIRVTEELCRGCHKVVTDFLDALFHGGYAAADEEIEGEAEPPSKSDASG